MRNVNGVNTNILKIGSNQIVQLVGLGTRFESDPVDISKSLIGQNRIKPKKLNWIFQNRLNQRTGVSFVKPSDSKKCIKLTIFKKKLLCQYQT